MMFEHYSVMLDESIELLNIKPDGIYVDMTMGGGGHSSKILEKLNKDGMLICFDQDQRAIDNGLKKFKGNSQVKIIKANFSDIEYQLQNLEIHNIDGVIFDLGVSSVQFDEADRGFSYRFDARLDMRMNQESQLDAYYIVNHYSYNELVSILFKYGEEKFAKQIARNIEKYREKKAIETTFELVEIIKESLPQSVLKKKGHPAKKTFQAIRIEVNQELEVFENALHSAVKMLNVGGRVVVITFHSLEDRMCKKIFKEYTTSNIPSRVPIAGDMLDVSYQLVNKKIIEPSKKELEENKRSTSSKLRGIERVRR